MRVITPKRNVTILLMDNGDEILVSYETPVAGRIGGIPMQSDTRYSKTTTKHINDYGYGNAKKVSQDFLDKRMKGEV